MTERINQNQAEPIHHMPPQWCGAICRNAMNQICIEQCAPNRDTSGFELKKGISLDDMPRFPIEGISKLTAQERLIVVSVYLAKVVDCLQGVKDEPEFIRRPHFDRTAGSQVSSDFKEQGILHGLQETNPNHPAGTQHQDQEI
jgi:hypothetical protein